MPIYEYVCNKCSEKFSLLRGINAKDDAQCPKCGSADVKKVLSSFCCSSGSGAGVSSGSMPSGGFGGGG
jgi:putative FmdB family regulatory protein